VEQTKDYNVECAQSRFGVPLPPPSLPPFLSGPHNEFEDAETCGICNKSIKYVTTEQITPLTKPLNGDDSENSFHRLNISLPSCNNLRSRTLSQRIEQPTKRSARRDTARFEQVGQALAALAILDYKTMTFTGLPGRWGNCCGSTALQAFQRFCHSGAQAPDDNLQCNEPNLASSALKV
jgi:hypothetical protein